MTGVRTVKMDTTTSIGSMTHPCGCRSADSARPHIATNVMKPLISVSLVSGPMAKIQMDIASHVTLISVSTALKTLLNVGNANATLE